MKTEEGLFRPVIVQMRDQERRYVMGFVKLTCPNCGANIELSADRDFGFCTYCGTKIVRDSIVVEHRGTVNVSGFATASSLLERTKLFIEGSEWDKALSYCDRILDQEPHNAEAYLLKLLSQTHCSCLEDLTAYSKPLEKFDSYRKAVRFASSEVMESLKSVNDATIRNYRDLNTRFNSDADDLTEQIGVKTSEMSKIRFLAKDSAFFHAIIWVLQFISFSCLVNKNHVFLGVLTIPVAIACSWFVNKKKKAYDFLQKELCELNAAYSKNQEEYKAWKNWADSYVT